MTTKLVGWVIVDKDTKEASRRTVSRGIHARKKATLFVSEGVARANCPSDCEVQPVYIFIIP